MLKFKFKHTTKIQKYISKYISYFIQKYDNIWLWVFFFSFYSIKLIKLSLNAVAVNLSRHLASSAASCSPSAMEASSILTGFWKPIHKLSCNTITASHNKPGVASSRNTEPPTKCSNSSQSLPT